MFSRSGLIQTTLIASVFLVGSCVQVVGTPGSSPGPGQAGAPTTAGATTPGQAPTAPAPPPSTVAGPGGSFIAFVRDGNVWIIAPDGSVSVPLTTDGATDTYTDPTVAPDGTVYALRGEDTLYHLDLAGHVLGPPVTLAVLENGAEGLSISPDGEHLAFVTTGWGTYVDARFGTYAGQYIYGGTDVITPDGRSVPGAAMGQMLYPTWVGASTLVVSDGTMVYVDEVPSAEPSGWLAVDNGCIIPDLCEPGQEPMAHLTEAVVNEDGTMLAYSYRPYFGTAGRRMLSLSGPPPGDATVRCLIEGQENFRDPGTLSADGRLFAYDDTVFDPDSLETTAGQGMWVMDVDLNASDCGASSARLVAPGGFQPDF